MRLQALEITVFRVSISVGSAESKFLKRNLDCIWRVDAGLGKGRVPGKAARIRIHSSCLCSLFERGPLSGEMRTQPIDFLVTCA